MHWPWLYGPIEPIWQVIHPQAFDGIESFQRQTSFLARACRQSPPLKGGEDVRTPGEAALRHKAFCLQHGVELYGDTMAKLQQFAHELGVPLSEYL